MKQTHHDEVESTGGIGALGLCVTVLASVFAFWVAGAGLFDRPHNERMVFIEKPKVPETVQAPADTELTVH